MQSQIENGDAVGIDAHRAPYVVGLGRRNPRHRHHTVHRRRLRRPRTRHPVPSRADLLRRPAHPMRPAALVGRRLRRAPWSPATSPSSPWLPCASIRLRPSSFAIEFVPERGVPRPPVRLAGEFLDSGPRRAFLPDVRSMPSASRPRGRWQNSDINILHNCGYFCASAGLAGRRLQSWNGREMSE